MRRLLPIALAIGLLSRPAAAQHLLELSAGYSTARDPRDQITLPAGWIAGAAIGVTPAVAVVGEVSGQYKTLALLNTNAHISTQTAMGGLRVRARLGRLVEFGQIAAGTVRASGSAFGATTSGVSIAVQPGAGVDWPLTRRWAARAQIDVRFMRSQPDAINGGYQYRFAAGLVYRVRPR